MTSLSIIYYQNTPWEESKERFNTLIRDAQEGNEIHIISRQECKPNVEQSTRSSEYIHWQHAPYVKNAYEAFNRGFDKIKRKEQPVLFVTDEIKISWEIIRELYDILSINEKHGIVVPRIGKQTGLEDLPRYSIVSSFDASCFLIRSQLVVNFGGFDLKDVFEVNRSRDMAMRVNRYGYSTLVANHVVVVAHRMNEETKQDNFRNERITDSTFYSRYPYYQKIEDIYLDLDNNPIDYFSSILNFPDHQKKKILFSLYNALPFYSGSVVHSLRELEAFYAQFRDKYEIHVLMNRDADAFFDISGKYPTVVYPDTISEQYHLAFSPTQFFHLEHLILLHRHALRIMFTMQDIIGIRCAYNMAPNPEIKFLFNLSMKFTDGICTFSDYAGKDIKSYFNSYQFKPFPRFKTIYLGADRISDDWKDTATLPFDEYILIFGNHFAHKSIVETMEVINEKGPEKNFIIVGLQEDFFKQPNIHTFPSGELEEQFIRSLYANATALLFSSQYEGFGLPIIEALQFGKPVILFNTELNRELFICLVKDCAENAIFFDYFHELPEILNNIDGFIEKLNLKRLPDTFRSWNDVARDIESLMDELLKESVNYRKLEERFSCLQAIGHFNSKTGTHHGTDRSFQAQVFSDTGKGYTEADSLTHWVTADASHLEFDLRKFQNVRQIRFDPMNIYGLISLKSVRVITSDDRIVDLRIRSHNARTKRGGVYLFDTDDSNIEFELPEQGSFKKLLITIHYIVVGQGVFAFLYRNQLGSIMMTETIHTFHRWKHRFKNRLLQMMYIKF